MNEAGRCAAILWNLNRGLSRTTQGNWYRPNIGAVPDRRTNAAHRRHLAARGTCPSQQSPQSSPPDALPAAMHTHRPDPGLNPTPELGQPVLCHSMPHGLALSFYLYVNPRIQGSQSESYQRCRMAEGAKARSSVHCIREVPCAAADNHCPGCLPHPERFTQRISRDSTLEARLCKLIILNVAHANIWIIQCSCTDEARGQDSS